MISEVSSTHGPLPWLYDHRVNVATQHGEDGVVEKIFETIGIANRWAVDIGAHDGKFLSNSWRWVFQDHWSGVLVEADPSNFEKLADLYQGHSNVHCLHEFVSQERSIDVLLSDTGVPYDLDLLSIDIDGMDYRLWAAEAPSPCGVFFRIGRSASGRKRTFRILQFCPSERPLLGKADIQPEA